MRRLIIGGFVGLAATVPMTLAMMAMHRRLPRRERYPLPPRKVAMELIESAGAETDRLDEFEKTGLTLASHFAYGAAVGAVYAPLAHRLPLPPVVSGVGYGLAVWAASYLGWLPAAGIISPATEHPARRNALMITAHVVWGATAGLLVAGLDPRRED